MNAYLPRVHGQLGVALAISVALHAVLLATLLLIQQSPAPKVISAINVRLSAAAAPAPQPESSMVVEEQLSEERLIETQVERPPIETTAAELPRTPPSAAVRPEVTRRVQLDAASLEAFINSTTDLRPPSLNGELSIAEMYRRQWHQRVQRIGQLNYPATASRMKLTGQLALRVAINTDGSLASVGIAQSSGHDELDFAALKIVRQASPFEPLPPNLPRTNDQFRFESTWEFRR